MNDNKSYTHSHYVNEVERVWLAAWQRELGADATLTHDEQTKLHKLRRMAENESAESQDCEQTSTP